MNGGGQSRRWHLKLTSRAGLAATIGLQRSRLTRKPVLIFGENGILGPCPMINEGCYRMAADCESFLHYCQGASSPD